MKICLFFIGLLVAGLPSSKTKLSQAATPQDSCLSAEEKHLYDLIMEYRKSKKLPVIPLSKSLTLVAKTHAKDLADNAPDKAPCNLHSWSDKGQWSSCCYYPDHRSKECMWNKPKEITKYKNPGFEIAYFSSTGIVPEQALQTWKKSDGHHAVIINTNNWKSQPWKAIGIGIYKNYVTVWFGGGPDSAGAPEDCSAK